jgi:plasmid stability protein
MPLLQIRSFPDELYRELSRRAKMDNRSIPQETITLLRDALNLKGEHRARREFVLERINKLDIKNGDDFADPAALVREDRER